MTKRRLLLLIAIAGSAAIAIATPFLKTAIEQRLRVYLERRASGMTSIPVTIETLRLTLIPAGARAERVRINEHEASPAPLGGSVERLDVRGAPLSLLGLRPGIIDIDVIRPRLRVRLEQRTDESREPSAWDGMTGALAAIPFAWDFSLFDGELDLEAPGPYGVDLRGIEIGLQSRRAYGAAGGRVGFTQGEVRGVPGHWEGLRGEAQVELTGEGLTIEPLSLIAPGFTLSGEGTVEGGSPASARGGIRIEVRHGILEELLPAVAVPTGTLRADLEGAWENDAASLTGVLEMEGIRLWNLTIANLRAALRVDDAVHLDDIRMDLLGGSGSGAIEADIPTSGDPSARAEVHFEAIDLARVLELAGWSGPEMSGTLTYDGRHTIAGLDPAGLSGSGKLQLRGLYRSPRGGELPLSASAGVEIAGTTLRFSEGTLQAGSARAAFVGTFTPGEGLNLRLTGASGDLSELLLFIPPPSPSLPTAPAPGASGVRGAFGMRGASRMREANLASRPRSAAFGERAVPAVRRGGRADRAVRLAAAREKPAPPASSLQNLEALLGSLGGRWEWDGEIGYVAGDVRFEGALRGRDLSVLGEALGELSADVTYKGGLLRVRSATLRRSGGGTVQLEGKVGLGVDGVIALNGEMSGFPAAVLARLASVELPIDGMIDASFAIAGSREHPEVHLLVDMGALAIAGLPLQTVRGDVTFTPDWIATESLRVEIEGKAIDLTGGLRLRSGGSGEPLEGSAPQRLELSAQEIDLSSLGTMLGDLPIEGRAGLSAAISGSVEAPLGRFTVDFTDVRLWHRDFGAGSIHGRLDPELLSIEGEIPTRNVAVRGSLELNGIGQFELRGTLDETSIEGEDVHALIPEGSRLVASGEVSLSGALRGSDGLRAAMELSSLQMSLQGFEVANSAPVIARLQDQVLRLDPVQLYGTGTRVDLQGELDLGDGGTIDASASGNFDLALLRTVVPQVQATGQGEVGVALGGAYGSPEMRGELRIDAERVRYSGVRIPIDNLKAHLLFEGEEVRVEELRFLTGGGATVGSGTLVLGNPDRQGGLGAIRAGSLRLVGDDVKASVPEGFQSVSDLDLELAIDAAGATLRGRVDLLRGIYRRDFRVESTLISDDQPATPALPPLAGLLGDVKLDCTLTAAGEVGLRNDLGRIDGEGALRVGGTVARPELTGRLTAVEGGRVTLRNVRYRVTQGSLDFDDPLSNDPTFEIRAETAVAEYQISLAIRGKMDNFDYELTSNPPLPESDIVSLLVTGRTLGDIGSEGSGFAEGIASSYLAGQLTQELSDQISALSALDVLTIDPLYVNGQGDPTTRITVGKRITPDLFVAYSDQFGSDQGSIYQLDYSINRDLRFSSVRDVDGSIGGNFSYLLNSLPPWLPGLDTRRPGESRREIGTIRIEGDPRFKESRVLRRAKLKPGRSRSRAELHDAVDRLLNFYRDHGYLMTDVRLEDRSSGEGDLDLDLNISTGPRISMAFEGIRGREGLRLKAEPFWEEGLFTDEIVETVRERLQEYIRDRGYLTAEVTAGVQRDDDDAFRVLYTVRRGPRAQADRIEVAGVSRLPQEEVLGRIKSSTDTWNSRGIVRGDLLRRDQAAVRELYLSEGFARVAVSPPEITLDDAGERAGITFRIREGPQVVLHGIRFSGAVSLTEPILLSVTELRVGEPYRSDGVEKAIVNLRRAYDGAGFPDARVAADIETLTRQEGHELIDVTFRLDEGLAQRVQEVYIDGNLITRQNAIRRALMMTPGDPLSRGNLQAGRSRLYRTGSFRAVQVEPLPADGTKSGERPGDDGGETDPGPEPGGDQFLPVKVTVQEAGRFRQLYGIGYDSEEKIRGQFEIANRNLFGTGRYLGLQTRASEIYKRGSIVYRETGLFGGRYDALISASWQDEVLPAYEAQRIGGAIQLSRKIGATELRYRYSLEDVDTSDPEAAIDEPTLRLSAVDFSASHDTRNNPFNPLQGHYLVGDVQVSGRALGSEADFIRFYSQVYTFREVFPNTVWAQAVRVGIGVPFSDSKNDPMSSGDAVSGMPQTRRFYAGGDTTIRGFEFNRVGPIDPVTGDPTGGEGMFILNEELRYPIFRRLQGVVFYDAGNIIQTIPEFALRDLRHVLGVGLRLATPIGPFRFEYGRILDPEPTDTSRGEYFISIGQAF